MLFPALFREPEKGRLGERVTEGSQAVCFFHAGRQAAVVCDRCGRFLCGLCDLGAGGRHTCPVCFGEGARGDPALESTRSQTGILYDNLAMALAVLPMVTIYGTFVGAPAALFVVFRYWNRRPPGVPRPRWRFVVAGMLAVCQIALWVLLGATLVESFR